MLTSPAGVRGDPTPSLYSPGQTVGMRFSVVHPRRIARLGLVLPHGYELAWSARVRLIQLSGSDIDVVLATVLLQSPLAHSFRATNESRFGVVFYGVPDRAAVLAPGLEYALVLASDDPLPVLMADGTSIEPGTGPARSFEGLVCSDTTCAPTSQVPLGPVVVFDEPGARCRL
jgi:hypothetical protein